MKNFIFSFLVLLCASYMLAQCPTGDLIFKTQEGIDNFAINYPDCKDFPGKVFIKESEPGSITNLKGLSSLTSIKGYLYIERNDNLKDLNGLNKLEAINGALYIGYNNALQSLSGLNKLSTIGDFLNVWNNPSLENLAGLENLFYADGSLYIGFNNRLSTLRGLENLGYVGGNLDIGNNPSLTNLRNLSELKLIEGCINIDNNQSLTSLSGLENIDPSSITDLEIIRSSQLSYCTISSFCDYLRLGGSAMFSGNAKGCNSYEEVFLNCNVGKEKKHQLEDQITNEEIEILENK